MTDSLIDSQSFHLDASHQGGADPEFVRLMSRVTLNMLKNPNASASDNNLLGGFFHSTSLQNFDVTPLTPKIHKSGNLQKPVYRSSALSNPMITEIDEMSL